MGNEKKISIIIPTYNVGKYVNQCIESLINQTEKNIELILVDDNSTDNTVDVINKWKETNENIVLIQQTVNKKAAQCRKDGVLRSTGEYIMFVDADDYLEANACEIALQTIETEAVDIVQFGTKVENFGGVPDSRIKSNENALMPTVERIEGDLLEQCFLERKFSFTIWNKIYNGDLCRKAMLEVEDGEFPKANDLYAAFFILYYAKSYCGIEDKLYHYCFGRGMTGRNRMSLNDYTKCCQSWLVYKNISKFGNPNNKSSFHEVLDNIHERLLNEQLGKLRNNVVSEDREKAIRILMENMEANMFEMIREIAKMGWEFRPEFAKIFRGLPELRYKPKRITNIAFYYRNIKNGGAQRVVANLASEFARLGNGQKYNIILITDEQPQDGEYKIDENVTRVTIPNYLEYSKKKYGERADALYRVIDTYHIDAFIDSMWNIQPFFWDISVVKSHPSHPAVIAHSHSAAGTMWEFKGNAVEETMSSYAMVDAIVVLSEVDKMYWKTINPNVYYIPNKLEKTYNKLPRKKEGQNTVLWVGRLSKEKQPLDIVEVIERVAVFVPDVKCVVVGDGEKEIVDNLRGEIVRRGLEKNIYLAGFQKDVDKYYSEADVLLFTSRYEGFSLTLFEAAAHGLPIVKYEIPWLTFNQCMEGYTTVPQGHVREAAEKIVELLTNSDLWRQQSRLAQDSYNKYDEIDIIELWRKLIDDLQAINDGECEELILLEELKYFHSSLVNQYKLDRKELNDKLQRTYKEKSQINAKLQSTYREKTERGNKIKELKAKLAKKNERIEKMKKKIANREARIAELESEVESMKKKKGVLKKIKDTIKKK
ncbi:glycosyltransferase [Eubacterium oxidoreducens]|uniref:Glycosyltransferase involved in cell wall bisynthesis n=1 Tax=Eubacterium oxidoreducens TaxID=1732 RepID=A0A1G6CCV4_EUBOX|nr:glycosyltransferase [Eubacterium oxidoreducens]SDB30699.1 Glycosyltransferase involved in cell wall bisynthesis [Eubacterium oxidoreducens]